MSGFQKTLTIQLPNAGTVPVQGAESFTIDAARGGHEWADKLFPSAPNYVPFAGGLVATDAESEQRDVFSEILAHARSSMR